MAMQAATPAISRDPIHERVKDSIALVSLGERTIKGYDHPLQVFAVARSEAAIRDPDCRPQRAEVDPTKRAV